MAATGSPARAGRDLAWSAAFEAMDMAAVCLDSEGGVLHANPFLLALAGRSPDEIVGRNWFSDLVSHRDRVMARRTVASVVASGKPARMRTSLWGRDGEIHLLDWSATPAVAESGQVGAVLLLGQVTGQNEAALAGLRTTNDIIRAVLAGQDPRGVLRAVAAGASDLLDADLGAIVVPADETELAVVVAVGFDAFDIEGTRYTRAGSTTERVMEQGRPVAVVSPDGTAKDRADHWFAPFGPGLFLPLSAGGQFGALILARLRGEPHFTDHDLHVVTTLTGQLALALEFARAQEDLRAEALLRDQERIARDLHDRVVQRIHAASWGLQAANSLGGAPEQTLRIERAVGELDRAVAEIRATIFAIHSETTGGLRDRIVRVVTEASERLGFTPSLSLQGDLDEVTRPTGEHLLSALQEALSNIARHAAAGSAEVTVAADPAGGLVLTVRDDGVGIGPSRSGGLGLRNLASRAELHGGKLSIERAPGGGTLLRWAVPVAATPGSYQRHA